MGFLWWLILWVNFDWLMDSQKAGKTISAFACEGILERD